MPPVARPDTEKVISPTSDDGASHSIIHSPETVLVLCWTRLPFNSAFSEADPREKVPALSFPA